MSDQPNIERRKDEIARLATMAELAEFYTNRRGGIFCVVDGARVHESDLTVSQRRQFNLPVAPDEPATTE